MHIGLKLDSYLHHGVQANPTFILLHFIQKKCVPLEVEVAEVVFDLANDFFAIISSHSQILRFNDRYYSTRRFSAELSGSYIHENCKI